MPSLTRGTAHSAAARRVRAAVGTAELVEHDVAAERAGAPLAIHPGGAGDREGLVSQAHRTGGRHARQGVVIRGVARLGALVAQALVALEDGRSACLKNQIDRGIFLCRPQAHGRYLAFDGVRRPVAGPHAEGRVLRSREAQGTAPPTLEGMETFTVYVGDGEMCEIGLPRRPRGFPVGHVWGQWCQSRAEKRELESESPPFVRFQVSGVIPPLGAEFWMRAVVRRKVEIARFESAG